MKKRIVVVAVICVPLALVAFFVARRLLAGRVDVEADSSAPVVVTVVEQGSIERTLSSAGTLLPKRNVAVFTKVPGNIERIHVKQGQLVEEGAELAEVEDQAVVLQMRQAEAAWLAAQAQYDLAKRGLRKEEQENARATLEQAQKDFDLAAENLAKYERLFDAGTIAKAEYEKVENNLQAVETSLENARRNVQMMEQGAGQEELSAAEANVRAMKAQYDLAVLQVDFTRIQAPVAGIVAQVLVDEGNLVGQSTPILTIVQDNPILAEIPIAERHYGDVIEHAATLEARVFPDAFGDQRSFRGTVMAVSTVIDPKSRTFSVELEIDNPRGELRPGMHAQVEIVLNRFEKALLVPLGSVVVRDGRSTVFTVVEDGSLHARAVTVEVGLSDQEQEQILSGLGAGDLVISEGNSFLEDGQEVKVLQQQ